MTALQLVDAIFCSFLWRCLSSKEEDLSQTLCPSACDIVSANEPFIGFFFLNSTKGVFAVVNQACVHNLGQHGVRLGILYQINNSVAQSLSETPIFYQLFKQFPNFIELEISLLCLLELASCPYPEPNEPSPRHCILFLQIHLLVLPCSPTPSSLSLPFRYPHFDSVYTSVLPHTCWKYIHFEIRLTVLFVPRVWTQLVSSDTLPPYCFFL